MKTHMRLLSGGFAALLMIVAFVPGSGSAQREPHITEYVVRGSLSVCNEFVGLAHRPAAPSVGTCGFFVEAGYARVMLQDWVAPSVAFEWTLMNVYGQVCTMGSAFDEATFVALTGCHYLYVAPGAGAVAGRIVVT